MKANISLEKDRIKLKGQGKKIIISLDPKEGAPWEEPDDSKARVRKLYQVMQSNSDMVKPNDRGELDIGSLTSVECNSNSDLYDWDLEKLESYAKDCWSIEAIPKQQVSKAQVCNCYSISIIPKIIEKKVKEYPTLIPTNVSTPKLRFKEEDSPIIHLNETSKNIGDQGRLQSSVELFTGQEAWWWGTH